MDARPHGRLVSRARLLIGILDARRSAPPPARPPIGSLASCPLTLAPTLPLVCRRLAPRPPHSPIGLAPGTPPHSWLILPLAFRPVPSPARLAPPPIGLAPSALPLRGPSWAAELSWQLRSRVLRAPSAAGLCRPFLVRRLFFTPSIYRLLCVSLPCFRRSRILNPQAGCTPRSRLFLSLGLGVQCCPHARSLPLSSSLRRFAGSFLP